MSNKLSIIIDLTVDKAINGLKKLKGSTDETGDAFDDARTAAQKLAAALDAETDRIVADLEAGQRAADALASALGPELAGSIGQSKIDSFVGDLRSLGITAEEVEADADALAASLKKSAAAADSIRDVDGAMTRLGESTDNSRSVMANFAGNAVQELPGVAEALGPLNMAIGQFAEYASEGNIKLKNFAAAGAGLGVAALAMWNIQDRMAKVAKINAFRTDNLKGYQDALRDADNEVQAIRDHLEEVGKVEFLAGDANGNAWTGGVAVIKDVTEVFARLGINSGRAAQLIAEGESTIREWGTTMKSAGANADAVNLAMGALIQQADIYSDAAENAAATTAFFGEKADKASPKVRQLSKDVRDDRDAMDEAKGATAALNEQMAILNGTISQKKLWDDYATALWNYKDGVGDTAGELDTLRLAAADVVVALKDMPEEQKTSIIAQINQGDMDTVNAILANLAKGINVPLRFQGQGGVGFMKNASGTPSSPGGLTLVGENGPELVNMPRGAQVFPAAQTAGMLNGGGANITINALSADPQAIMEAIHKYARRGGRSPW